MVDGRGGRVYSRDAKRMRRVSGTHTERERESESEVNVYMYVCISTRLVEQRKPVKYGRARLIELTGMRETRGHHPSLGTGSSGTGRPSSPRDYTRGGGDGKY